jgi:hypothetical protein
VKHQSKCGCYYCTKIRKEQQAKIAALSAERLALTGGAR